MRKRQTLQAEERKSGRISKGTMWTNFLSFLSLLIYVVQEKLPKSLAWKRAE